MKIEGNKVTVTVANYSPQVFNSVVDTLRYILIANWNVQKTISYTDFKVKPL